MVTVFRFSCAKLVARRLPVVKRMEHAEIRFCNHGSQQKDNKKCFSNLLDWLRCYGFPKRFVVVEGPQWVVVSDEVLRRAEVAGFAVDGCYADYS